VNSQTQIELDWTTTVHRHENNAASEAVLKENYYHFTGQCAVVYSLLKKGLKLTSKQAMNSLGIGHLARRIGDLRDAGIEIEAEPVLKNGKKTRYVKYYLKRSND
jgi:hypothetical protein